MLVRYITTLFAFFGLFNVKVAQVEIIPTTTTKHLTQLSVINNNVVVTGREDYMVKSKDAATTFTPCNLPGPAAYQNYLCRVDSNLQYLLSSSFPAYNNKIYKSTDGGENWTLKLDTTGLILEHILFFDSFEGIALGTYGTYCALVRTKNGGNSWAPFLFPSLPIAKVTSVKVFDDSIICMAGIHGATGSILVSNDRGNTWPHGSGGFASNQPTSLFFINKDTILGISSPGNSGSYFTKTFNGGVSWQNTVINKHAYLDMYFKNAKEGYIVGMNNLNEGIILKTKDLGQHWESFNTHINTLLEQIEFLNDSIALISGSNGVLFKWNSKTAIFTSLTTGIQENLFDNLHLSIFPNPVQNKLVLDFEETKMTINKLSISNSLGQQIYTFEYPENKRELDVSFLSAGIYYLKVESKEGYKVFKVVKE